MAIARALLLLSGLAALIASGSTQLAFTISTPSTPPTGTTDTTTARTFGRVTRITTTSRFNRFGRTTPTTTSTTDTATTTTTTTTTTPSSSTPGLIKPSLPVGQPSSTLAPTTLDTSLGRSSPVTTTIPTTPSTITNQGPPTTGGTKGIPRVNDQTNQTHAMLSHSIDNVTSTLDANLVDLKSFIATQLQALSNAKLAAADLKSVQTTINSISSFITGLFGSTETRVKRTLVEQGTFLNNSIASIVTLEQSYLGKFKLSSNSKAIAKSLRLLDTAFYNNLTNCLNTFNGSVLSDTMTIENTLHTIVNGVLSPADDLVAAGCPSSKDCSTLLRSIPSSIDAWRSTVNTAFNQLPNANDFRTCVTTQVNLARTGINDLANTAPPAVDFRAVLTNETDILHKNVSSSLANFSTSYQTWISPVANQINTVRIFVNKNSQYDPKTIMKQHFTPTVTSTDEAVAAAIAALLPKITTLHRSLVVPLLSREQSVSTRISQAIVRNTTTAAANCDAAVQTILSAKTTFNASMTTCLVEAGITVDSILAGVKTSVVGAMGNFSSAIQSASSFVCANPCQDAAMQQVATQLKSKLDAGVVQQLTDMKKKVTDQVGQAFASVQKCMNDGIQVAMSAIDEKTSASIKTCLGV